MAQKVFDEVLLIHMGGLGDVCLSESTFYSFSCFFPGKVVALGVKRYLSLFSHYFVRVEDIESKRWLFLFSSEREDVKWRRIVFLGKDREGTLREKLDYYSEEKMLFVDMYPDTERTHVEDYQLWQLKKYGIPQVKKEITSNIKPVVIIYPEKGFKKRKWEYERFIDLERRLKKRKITTLWLGQRELLSYNPDALHIEDLLDLKKFFECTGGIFVSNDSGIAHLAGCCGLYTITLFFDTDPDVWHPRGMNRSLTAEKKCIEAEEVERIALDIFFTFFPEYRG